MPSTSGGRSGDFSRPRSPERRSGDYAVPRGMNETEFGRTGAPSGRRPAPNALSGPDAAGEQRRAVPAYSRPRDGRRPVGEAIDRRDSPVRGGVGGGSIIFYPYYDPYYGYSSRFGYGYGPWFGGYGFGLGYFYDPWGYYGYYSPYNYDYGYGSGSYSRYGSYDRGYRPVGNLRLKVKPEFGQVYVDGYYAGEVDSFDGVFQRLALEAGAHKVEIRAEGFETVTFDVMVTPGETVTYKGEMKRIQ